MKYDIRVSGNMIDGRQGWAYVCNSRKLVVLAADLDKEQEYGEYKTFGKVRVLWEHRGHEIATAGTLEAENGRWTIGGTGCMLKGDFTYRDRMESIEEANLQAVRKDDIVAIACHSKEMSFAYLMLYRVGRIDPNCMTMAELKPLTDEEMQEVKADATRWCDR